MESIPVNLKERRLVLWTMAVVGASALMTQLALMREMLTVFTGNEMAVGVMLGSWLLLTGAGAWLGRYGFRVRRPVEFLSGAMIVLAVVPLMEVVGLRVLRNAVFLRGAMVGMAGTMTVSMVVLAPFCVLSGFLLALACGMLSGDPRDALRQMSHHLHKAPPTGDVTVVGKVYVADSLGSIAGGAVFSFVLVAGLGLDHFAALCVPAALCLGTAVVLASVCRARLLRVTAAVLLGGLALGLNMDEATTRLQFLPMAVVFRGNSPYGKLVVTESAQQLNFVENGVPLFSTGNAERVEETVHFAMAQRPGARRVLLMGGGASGTAREILKYTNVASVVYVELDPMILEAARALTPGALGDARIRVVNSDGRLFVREGAGGDRFDVVIVDTPEPATAAVNRLYTAEFFGELKRVMTADGVVAVGVCPYANYVGPEMARMLATMEATLRRSFRQVSWVPAGQAYALASEGKLTLEGLGERWEMGGVKRAWVTREFLVASLAADRVGQLEAAARSGTAGKGATVNADFSPVLYLQHLQYWLKQKPLRSGLLVALLVTGLITYPFFGRGTSLVVFAGGFAGAALEMVLLLAFQVMCGSLYFVLGLVVTAFMAGLAMGAWMGNRGSELAPRTRMLMLAFSVAAFAAMLPMALTQMAGMSVAGVRMAVTGLAFGLAVLVGMEFPIASRTEWGLVSLTASRVYVADYLGACLGALLTSAVLIPLVGVTVTCWSVAGLNVLSAVALPRKVARGRNP